MKLRDAWEGDDPRAETFWGNLTWIAQTEDHHILTYLKHLAPYVQTHGDFYSNFGSLVETPLPSSQS